MPSIATSGFDSTAPQEWRDLKAKYESAGQGHVFNFFSELSNEEKLSLISQLRAFDPFELNKIYERALSTTIKSPRFSHVNFSPHYGAEGDETWTVFEPLPKSSLASAVDDSSNLSEWWDIGLNIIKSKKLAIITLSGGQGTRLGTSLPKGCYNIGLPSKKSLFQIQAERIKRLENLSGSFIYWYIMTSSATHVETVQFFKSHHYFTLNPSNVFFFSQESIPSLDEKGKILLESKSKISCSPNGNGGIYYTLQVQGLIQQMEDFGVEHIQIYGVDNILSLVGDPKFIGYCAHKNVDTGSKVVTKRSPDEKVGVFCKKNGLYHVLEYSEMSEFLNNSLDESGNLKYRYANIAIHYFSFQFLKRLVTSSLDLDYHIAKKKITHIDPKTGHYVCPILPNGIKLELFIFDVFPLAHSACFLQVNREEEFSALKNPSTESNDTAETSKRALMKQHVKYLLDSKWNPQRKRDTLDLQSETSQQPGEEEENLICEISPLVTFSGEGLPNLSNHTLEFPLVINQISDFNKYLV